MNLILRTIHRVHYLFKLDPNMSRQNKEDIDLLKEKILNGKKKDLKELKKTNGEIRRMVKKVIK